MIKSPLRYPGGKSKVAEKLVQLLPDFDEFREPFLGGGSVFLQVKQKYPNKIFWVNDLYEELYLFWRFAQENPTSLLEKIEQLKANHPIGKQLFQHLNANMSSFDEPTKAAAFFIYNRITFSGTSLSGGYSEAAFLGRFTPSSIQRLSVFFSLLAQTKITQLDYAELLQKEGKRVAIFLDPPYYSATKSALYGNKGNLHKCFDHQRFAMQVKACKHKCLITYDDSPYIRELFSFAHIFAWDLRYGMRNVNKHSDTVGKELLIANYPLKHPPIASAHQANLFSDFPLASI
jgi:DNA adenine methylase